MGSNNGGGGANRGGLGGGGNYNGNDFVGANPDRTIREGVRDLGQLRQTLRDNPDLAKELGEAYRTIQSLNGLNGNDAELEQRLRNTVLPNIESLELLLRRQVEEQKGGQVRSGATERAPAGYADKVAEYFRRLSNGK